MCDSTGSFGKAVEPDERASQPRGSSPTSESSHLNHIAGKYDTSANYPGRNSTEALPLCAFRA